MTKEARMTNYRKRRFQDRGDLRVEEFCGARNGTRAVELWETASDGKPDFDLEERTARFGEAIIAFAKKVPVTPVTRPLIDQVVRAGTSVGANYCEANDSVSQKDFRYTIKRCLKEAKETRFFLRMVAASEPELATEARSLFREASELARIFASMYRK